MHETPSGLEYLRAPGGSQARYPPVIRRLILREALRHDRVQDLMQARTRQMQDDIPLCHDPGLIGLPRASVTVGRCTV